MIGQRDTRPRKGRRGSTGGPLALAATSLVAVVAVVTVAAIVAFATTLNAESYEDRRTDASLKIFRALLAADIDLEKKALDDKHLLVVFFYTDDGERAAKLSRSFAKADAAGEAEPVRGLPVLLETASDPAFAPFARRVPAGIFLAQSPNVETLKSIIRYGITHHVIVYSPFEGHVESGVLGGLAVEAQVRPYVNFATLTASSISLKEFFLKVTKVYR